MQQGLFVLFQIAFVITILAIAQAWYKRHKGKVVNKNLLNFDFTKNNLGAAMGISESRLDDITRDVTALLKLNDFNPKKVLQVIYDNYDGAELILAISILHFSLGVVRGGAKERAKAAEKTIYIFEKGERNEVDTLLDLLQKQKKLKEEEDKWGTEKVPHDADDKIKNNMAPEVEEQ